MKSRRSKTKTKSRKLIEKQGEIIRAADHRALVDYDHFVAQNIAVAILQHIEAALPLPAEIDPRAARILRLEDAPYRQPHLCLCHHGISDRVGCVREGHKVDALFGSCKALEHEFRDTILGQEVGSTLDEPKRIAGYGVALRLLVPKRPANICSNSLA
jgi:hypothetical protein